MRSGIEALRQVVADHDKTSNAAHDLWTHLPSHEQAKKHHGDYAVEHMPCHGDIIVEANLVLGIQRGSFLFAYTELKDWFGCPCDEHWLDDREALAIVAGIEKEAREGLGVFGEGAWRIAVERQRQVTVEGWTPTHDDAHENGEMAAAAACYARLAAAQLSGNLDILREPTPPGWPWTSEWWKPSGDPARNLEKAGALSAAEIDRLARKQA